MNRASSVIEYRAGAVRPIALLVSALALVMGLFVLGSLHVSRLSCARALDAEPGVCHARRYGLVGSFDERFAASEVSSFDVRVTRGSKGGDHATVRLHMTPSSHRPPLELASGSLGGLAPETAYRARAAFDAFQSGHAQSIRASLFSPWRAVVPVLLGVGLVFYGAMALREQRAHLRPARIEVAPAREVVRIGGREIPWADIADVRIAEGPAYFWSKARRARTVFGHRLVVLRHSGDDVPVTKPYLAGDRAAPERARRELLDAIGRRVV